MAVAAIQIAKKKLWAQRSWRVWIRRQSLRLPNMFSILGRCRYSAGSCGMVILRLGLGSSAIMTLVGDQFLGCRQGIEQQRCTEIVAGLAFGEQRHQRPALAIGDGVPSHFSAPEAHRAGTTIKGLEKTGATRQTTGISGTEAGHDRFSPRSVTHKPTHSRAQQRAICLLQSAQPEACRLADTFGCRHDPPVASTGAAAASGGVSGCDRCWCCSWRSQNHGKGGWNCCGNSSRCNHPDQPGSRRGPGQGNPAGREGKAQGGRASAKGSRAAAEGSRA